MAEQTADASTDLENTVEQRIDVIGTEWVPYDDEIEHGPQKYRQLVVERDGERVGVPISNVQHGTTKYGRAEDDRDELEDRRLTRTHDRVYAEELENGTLRFVAEVESNFHSLGRVAVEHVEDLDENGEPMETFTYRKVQTNRADEDDVIHPDEINEDARAKIWERSFDGRIGPKMKSAVRFTAGGPYASKNQLAKSVGPHGSQDYGYRIVNRCLSRRLLRVDPDHPKATPSGQGAVVLTKRGEAFLEHMKEGDN